MSYAVYYPELKKGLVYFSNSENGLSIARELVTRIIPDDHMALNMLNVEEYDAPGPDEEIKKRQAFINGDIKAGEGIYYQDPIGGSPKPLNILILNWIYDRFFS